MPSVTPAATGLPAAIVLAGGRSSRMGGGDKSFRLLGGQPLIAHVLGRLKPQASAVAISTNGDPERFGEFVLPILPDTVPGYLGPLAGLLAGMQWAQSVGATHILSMPTDTPFFPENLGASLAEASRAGAPVLAASSGRRHPAVGLWPVALAGRLGDFLRSGTTYKVAVFADQCGAAAVDFPMIAVPGRSLDPFFNVNTPADLAFAETLLGELRQ
jgi:molybdopterin-guanine dinucleotide biosynthesis protein A